MKEIQEGFEAPIRKRREGQRLRRFPQSGPHPTAHAWRDLAMTREAAADAIHARGSEVNGEISRPPSKQSSRW